MKLFCKLLFSGIFCIILSSCEEETKPPTSNLPMTANPSPEIETTQKNSRPAEPLKKKKILVKDKSKWSIIKASSFNKKDLPQYAIDGNGKTIWHSQFQPKALNHPHELQIDLASEMEIIGFSYLTRQLGPLNGTVKEYEFYATIDLKNWGEPVAKGTFTDIEYGRELQIVEFTNPVKARYILFRSISEVTGQPFACCAEINVLIESP